MVMAPASRAGAANPFRIALLDELIRSGRCSLPLARIDGRAPGQALKVCWRNAAFAQARPHLPSLLIPGVGNPMAIALTHEFTEIRSEKDANPQFSRRALEAQTVAGPREIGHAAEAPGCLPHDLKQRKVSLGRRSVVDHVFYPDDQYVLNYATKYLARFNLDRRHSYGPADIQAPRDRIAEAWRFPIVDTYGGGAPAVTLASDFGNYNTVTFIYPGAEAQSPASVGIIGSFVTLHSPVSLRQVSWEGEATRFWSLSCAVSKGQKHKYRFIVDDAFPANDPVNPQEEVQDNGAIWSSFYTESYSSPVVMERWEIEILYRLAEEILPFQTADAANFLTRFYDYLDRASQDSLYAHVYRMDTSVGEVNFIDNILAREERHHLADYKICLHIIDRVLRQRNPYVEPKKMSRNVYFALYNEMASNNVAGWDYNAYSSPQYFLYLLRRHVATGAFCHPKYGGNAGAAGWAYLEDRYRLPSPAPAKEGATLFDWSRALEKPLGSNADYLG